MTNMNKTYYQCIFTKPSGPILGASEDVAPTSPPTHLKNTEII